MVKIILILGLLLTPNFMFGIAGKNADSVLAWLVQKAEIKQDEVLVVEFASMGECVKCDITSSYLYSCFRKTKKIKTLALVNCKRDIELQKFAKDNKTFEYFEKDDGKLKKYLNLSFDIRMLLVNADGKIITTIDIDKYQKVKCEEIQKLIGKEQK